MSKSEEVCKLLNIEPKYYFKDSFNCWTRGTKYAFETEQDNIKWKLVYPDLTEPSNFVKLLEMPDILIDSADFESYSQKDYIGILGEAILSFGLEYINRESFLDCLILAINEDYFEDIDTIQHQAQQTNWTY